MVFQATIFQATHFPQKILSNQILSYIRNVMRSVFH